MDRFLADLYERPVPRYTSYPTAVEFHDGIGPAEQGAALDAVPAGMPVSLYLHIPYCREICWYCGCNTGALGRADRITPYVEALAAEIDQVARRMRGRVVSIHFGGGSPNALPAQTLAALITRLRTAFATVERPEIAVELDPRLASADYAGMLAQAGVTRASLGVQCFAPHVQARIHRIQPATMVEAAVRDLRAAGIGAINFDLLHGLPGQSIGDVEQTIAHTLEMRPDRIALFGYAHHPRLLPRQRMIDAAALPRGPERFAQSVRAHDRLVAAGYQPIGFDHFALPGDALAIAAREGRLRRNFQGFTDEPGEAVIGLGASAISQFPGLLAQNEKHVGRYREAALAARLPTVRGVMRGAEDRLLGEAIERLLCDRHVDLDAAADRHGMDGATVFRFARDRLAPLAKRGLVAIDGGTVSLNEAAVPYMRVAAAAFDRYRPLNPAG
jgi:oxygen-independent coproporphyrinogen III oxidase